MSTVSFVFLVTLAVLTTYARGQCELVQNECSKQDEKIAGQVTGLIEQCSPFRSCKEQCTVEMESFLGKCQSKFKSCTKRCRPNRGNGYRQCMRPCRRKRRKCKKKALSTTGQCKINCRTLHLTLECKKVRKAIDKKGLVQFPACAELLSCLKK